MCFLSRHFVLFDQGIVAPLFSENIDEVGDLVLDLGEAYYDIGKYLVDLWIKVGDYQSLLTTTLPDWSGFEHGT